MPGHQRGAPLIDPELLPARALIDSGVFLRFLGHRPDDPESPICLAFCRAMMAGNREILVAAPTLAEVTRKGGNTIPRTRGITVVPFDDRAAEVLAIEMPMAKLHEAKAESGRTLTYLKYDAMIIACAARGRASSIVTLDRDHAKLATGLGLRVAHPDEFRSKQMGLAMRIDPVSKGAPAVALSPPAPSAPAADGAPSAPTRQPPKVVPAARDGAVRDADRDE